MKTIAEELREEEERLRRRVVHATRPKGPLTMDQAAELHMAMEGKCPICRGEKIVGYLSSDNSKPPEQGACYACDGTGLKK